MFLDCVHHEESCITTHDAVYYHFYGAFSQEMISIINKETFKV